MTLKQKAVLAQLAYLDNTEDFKTVGELVKHYRNKPGYDSKEWLESFNAVESDPYLQNLKIVGYKNNNEDATKSGFVGYAFAERACLNKWFFTKLRQRPLFMSKMWISFRICLVFWYKK